MNIADLAVWAPVPILAYIIASDLHRLRIPNASVLALLAVFLATQAPFLEVAVLISRFAVASAALAVGFVLFAARLLGGGDVKLLTVVLLFVPFADLSLFCLGLSLCIVVTLSVIKMARATPAAGRSNWLAVSQTRRLPLGPAIALALIIYRPLGDFTLRLMTV